MFENIWTTIFQDTQAISSLVLHSHVIFSMLLWLHFKDCKTTIYSLHHQAKQFVMQTISAFAMHILINYITLPILFNFCIDELTNHWWWMIFLIYMGELSTTTNPKGLAHNMHFLGRQQVLILFTNITKHKVTSKYLHTFTQRKYLRCKVTHIMLYWNQLAKLPLMVQ